MFDCPVVQRCWAKLEARQHLPPAPLDYEDLYASFPSGAPLSDRQAWHRTMAFFWHGIYRLVIYYRWYSPEPPPVNLKHLVDFLKRWLTRKGTLYPSVPRRRVA